MGLFLGYFPLNGLSVFMLIQPRFDYYSFAVLFKIKACDASGFILLKLVALGLWGLLLFHINFRILCSTSMKNAISSSIEIVLNW